jgi:maltose alpha-D-glucosyltransferase/alpha-amylase
LIGVRTAEMHLALASGNQNKDFKPEDFSLHYQRSLFASMLSLLRETYQGLNRNLDKVLPQYKNDVENIIKRRDDIQNTLKRIHLKKLDVIKIRIHGNFDLEDVLLTGKDIAIQDFGGDPFKSFSERRLKRSALRDVAAMIRSLHYVAYQGFHTTAHMQQDELESLLPFAEHWAFFMSSFFVRAYLDTVKGSLLVPDNMEDLEIMLQTYLLEKAIADLNNEIANDSERQVVPIKIIQSIIK